MVDLSHLISHRFRGFSPHENSLEGLNAALDFGVKIIEFDVRVALCGTPMIYHDEYGFDHTGARHFIADTMAYDFAGLGGDFAHIPTADSLLESISQHIHQDCHLLIDVKDAGFETEINALVHLYRLQNRATYVSWVPEALYNLDRLAPSIPKCLSHWCQKPGADIRQKHHVYRAIDGDIPRSDKRYIHGERSGWFVNGPLRGKMRALISSVCVPQDMVTRDLVADYHEDDIMVSTFSYLTWDHIDRHKSDFDIDLFFIDSKHVFETIV